MPDTLRERVAIEMFYADSDYCGGKWENEPDGQKEYWMCKADAILAIFAEERVKAQAKANLLLFSAQAREAKLVEALKATVEPLQSNGCYRTAEKALAAIATVKEGK